MEVDMAENDAKLQASELSLRKVWYVNNDHSDFESYLSHWKVLESFLESSLQVGTIHEILGNSDMAKEHLQWGQNISLTQGLPVFSASFSIILGKLYQKKKLCDLAEKEFDGVHKILIASESDLSCLKCKLTLEATLYQHFGDLFQSNVDETDISLEKLTQSENAYNIALDKCNFSAWKNSVNNVEEESGKDYGSVPANQTDSRNIEGESKANMETKNFRKAANAHKASKRKRSVILDTNTRAKRLKCEPSTEGQSGKAACGCWHCLCMEVMTSRLIDKFIDLKWEFIRRQLLARLLIGRGTCLGILGKVHEMHESFLKGFSALASKTLYDNTNNSLQSTILLELIGKEFQEDVFAVERTELLYITSWFLLKSRPTNVTGFICCHLFQVEFPKLVFWLKLAFILGREVPTILQKVSRLLAIVHMSSLSSDDDFPLTSHNAFTLTQSHWSSFFHQASLGIHFNYQCHSTITLRNKVHDFDKDKEFSISSSTCIEEQTWNLLRIAPESIGDLEEFIIKFFKRLPCTTTLCITLFGKPWSSLLQDLFNFPSRVRACVLLSRFNSTDQPLVVIFPVDPLLQESLEEVDSEEKEWQYPWGFSAVEDVFPEFKMILKENLRSFFPNSKISKELRWSRRKDLDDRLQKLLRTIEDSWLGPCRIMLMGDRQPRSTLDSVCNKLVRDLELKAKKDVNKSLLKVILEGSKDHIEAAETFVSVLCSKNGCYVGRRGYCDEQGEFAASSGSSETSALTIKLIFEAISELEEDIANREPIILVLDSEVQMLPWESIPILRKQEVYRMPSVGSISMMFDRSKHHQTQDNTISFPMIDPLDMYYLLNPSGDQRDSQQIMANWFKDLQCKGMARSAPPAEELAVFLESHDLFVYIGHGCGRQYISRKKIQGLRNCAGSLLMGCSSGSFQLDGSYAPQGTPLSYLQGGSPFIVATLWEVSDKELSKFAKALLNAWLGERSNVFEGCCSQCNLACKEPGSSNSGYKAANCNHRRKIGSFMSEARVACEFPFLDGASTVCYGVPTGIWKQETEIIKDDSN